MAIENSRICLTKVAAGTIRQYRFVKLNSAGNVVECSVDGELPFGVAQEGASSGDAVAICVFGETKVRLGENVMASMTVGTLNDGTAGEKQFSATGSDSGDWNVGQCTVGGLSGEIATILFGIPTFKAA